MKRTLFPLICLMALSLILASGCRQQRVAEPVDPGIALAVAGFTQPDRVEDLLAGTIPPGTETATPAQLNQLDNNLQTLIRTESKRSFKTADETRECQETTLVTRRESQESALAYWVNVGKCMKVEYLLVPQITYWRDRDGQEMGVNQPASVILDMYVVDVAGDGLVSRFHFDESQVSLSENLLTMDKFLSRGGKWVTAVELASEGLKLGLQKLGL